MATDKITIVIDADASKAIKDFVRLNKEQEKQEGLLGKLKSKWVALGGVFAAGLGIQKLTEATKSFAKFQQASNATAKQFGKNADEILKSLRKVSGGTIDNNNLIEAANKALALNVTKDIGQMAKLLEIARVRARALGTDTTDAFNDIVTGIGRSSPLILDNLGIITKGWDAQAKAQGVAFDSQFILNKVLADGAVELAKVGPLTLTAAERFQQLSAQFTNAKTALGQALLPVFETILPILSSLITGFTALPTSLKATGSAALVLAPAILALNAAFGPIGIAIAVVAAGTVFLTGKLKELNAVTDEQFMKSKRQEAVTKKKIQNNQASIESIDKEIAALKKKDKADSRIEILEKKRLDRLSSLNALSKSLEVIQAKIAKQGAVLGKSTADITGEYEALLKGLKAVEAGYKDVGATAAEMTKEQRDKIESLVTDTVSLGRQLRSDLTSVFGELSDRRLDQLEMEKQAIQDKVDSGILSEEEGATKMAAIRDRENKERTKQAKLAKANALFEIALSQATGTARIWSKWGEVPWVAAALTAALAGVGIAQTAIVASQPVPQFAEGTNDAPGGLSLVGEQGPELVNIPENGQVVTNDILRSLANNGSMGGSSAQNINISIETNDPQQFVNRLQAQYGVDIFGAG